MLDLHCKNVVYVGGFGGIGFETCKSLLAQKIKSLAILDLIEEKGKLQELQNISNDTIGIFNVKMDITKKLEVETAFAEIHEKMGNFDVVINGSGIMDEQELERMLQVNLLGVIYVTFTAMRYMDKTKGGQGGLIVNISSVLGLSVYGAYPGYTATKHAVTGFTRSMADPFYYERSQVGLITICPGTTETPLINRKRPDTSIFKEMPLPEFLHHRQSARSCAERLIEALKQARNGSIWVIMGGELKEWKVPMEMQF